MVIVGYIINECGCLSYQLFRDLKLFLMGFERAPNNVRVASQQPSNLL